MKNAILYLVILPMLVMSCHGKNAMVRLSCCAKDNTTAMPAIPTGIVSNGSIYQLPGKWTDQRSRLLSLDQLKGKVQLVAMVFTHCGYACPRIVEDMRSIEDSLPASEKYQVDYVLVSLDPERDTAGQLLRFAAQMGLDDHWELLHGSADQVRELSMLLDVKYQKLPDGNFTHSNGFVVLDRRGDIARQYTGLGQNTGAVVSSIHRLLDQ